MSPGIVMVLLTVVGIGLIIAEVFLPGGILGIAGLVLVIIGGGIGVYFYPDMMIPIIAGEVLLVAAAIGIGVYVMMNTRIGRPLMQMGQSPQHEPEQQYPASGSLIGKKGVVTTQLRPAGTVEIEDERIDAVAEGLFIPAGAPVRVVEVSGNRVVVESLDEGE